MSEEDIDFLMSIQGLEQPEFDNACLERENKKLENEIERQKEVINGMIDNEEKYNLEIIKLKSIIKEVREYMNKNEIEEVYLDCKLYETRAYKDILDILEKDSDKE